MTPSPPDSPLLRQRVIYHGRVQGVGFRYTTATIAAQYPVCGYVRNQPDGTVELVLEGTAANCEAMLDDIQRVFARHVRLVEISPESRREPFTGFEVRR